jgi:DNA-binding CsgD family transcriptional regulator
MANDDQDFDLDINDHIFHLRHNGHFDRVDSALLYWHNNPNALASPDAKVLYYRAVAVMKKYTEGPKASQGWYEKCIPFLSEVTNPELKGLVYIELGNQYLDVENYLLAQKYYDEAEEVFTQHKLGPELTELALVRAMFWRKVGALDRAAEVLSRYNDWLSKLPNDNVARFNYYRIQLAINQDLHKWEDCEGLLLIMRDFAFSSDQSLLLSIYHEDATKLADERKQPFLVLHHAQELLKLNKGLNNVESMAFAYLMIAKTHSRLGEFYEAKKALMSIDTLWFEEIADVEFQLSFYQVYMDVLRENANKDEILRIGLRQNEVLSQMDSLRNLQILVITDAMTQLKDEWSVREGELSASINHRILFEVILLMFLVVMSLICFIMVRKRFHQKLKISHSEANLAKNNLVKKDIEIEKLRKEVSHLSNVLQNIKPISDDIVSSKETLSKKEWESLLDTELRDTEYRLLCLLASEPDLGNAQLAERLFLSQDGMRNALKRLYQIFHVETDGENKRVSLVLRILSYKLS